MTYSEVISSGSVLFIITVAGFRTILGGRLIALTERRVKKVVAFRTLSQMGLATMTYGLGRFYVGYYNLVAHGLAKRLLFLQVGYFIHVRYRQQNTRLWSMRGQIEGLLQVQVLLRLFSLCGISFTSGIVSKELILERIQSSRWRLVLLFGLVVSIYLTFMYRYLIYGTLFINRLTPTSYRGRRVTVLVCTVIGSLCVISYSYWSLGNLVRVPYHFRYTEVWLPLLVLGVMLMLSHYLVNSNISYTVTY